MSETLFRTVSLDIRAADRKKKVIPSVLSTETGVKRGYGIEVLDHSPGSVDLSRATRGLPLLWGHDLNNVLGRVRNIRVEGKKLRGDIHCGESTEAQERFADMLAGNITDLSVGYSLNSDPVRESGDVYRFTDWTVNEVSATGVGADPNAGLFRSAEFTSRGNRTMENNQAIEPTQDDDLPSRSQRRRENKLRETAEFRVQEIMAIARDHDFVDLGLAAIQEGRSAESFRNTVLAKLGGAHPAPIMDDNFGMGNEASSSFLDAINMQIDHRGGDYARAIETSEHLSRMLRRPPRGVFVPCPVPQRRDLNVGTDTAGGHLVSTDLLSASFIDVLRNKAQVAGLGATFLRDLQGNVDIPRQTSGSTAYWVAEGAAPTESQAAFDQVALRPKSVAGLAEYTRRFLKQSSIDAESFVRNDLATTVALEIDRVCINGSGTGEQPTGILNTSGIGDVPIGTNGGVPTYDLIVDLGQELGADNADQGSLGFLVNTVTRAKLLKTLKVSGDAGAGFVWEGGVLTDGRLLGIRAAVSNQVPGNLTKGTGTNLSAILYGNFADLLIGEWGVLDILVDPYSLSSTGGVRVTAFFDVDISVRHPQSFAAIQDAVTA